MVKGRIDCSRPELYPKGFLAEYVKKVKARLVCRGFEEQCTVQSDSPTCGKDVLRLFLSITAMNDWVLGT